MVTKQNLSKILIIVLVLVLAISTEVECRRKILRGRKTITRTYMRSAAVPPYVVIILVGLAQIMIGGLFYLLLKISILDKPITPRYQISQLNENEP